MTKSAPACAASCASSIDSRELAAPTPATMGMLSRLISSRAARAVVMSWARSLWLCGVLQFSSYYSVMKRWHTRWTASPMVPEMTGTVPAAAVTIFFFSISTVEKSIIVVE
jgi:hypothetical protein